MEQQEKETRQFIFISKDKNSTTMLLVDKDCINDGRQAQGIRCNYSGLKIPARNAGVIYEMDSTPNGESVSYSKVFAAKGWWKNQEDRIGWQLEQRQKEDLASLEKLVKTDDLEELLRPIRNKIINTHTRTARAAMLARVIDYLTR